MNISEALVEAMAQRGEHPAIARLCERMAYESVREDTRALVRQLIPPGLEGEIVECWKRAFDAMEQGKPREANDILQGMHKALSVYG